MVPPRESGGQSVSSLILRSWSRERVLGIRGPSSSSRVWQAHVGRLGMLIASSLGYYCEVDFRELMRVISEFGVLVLVENTRNPLEIVIKRSWGFWEPLHGDQGGSEERFQLERLQVVTPKFLIRSKEDVAVINGIIVPNVVVVIVGCISCLVSSRTSRAVWHQFLQNEIPEVQTPLGFVWWPIIYTIMSR
jgi:hypothetical protein